MKIVASPTKVAAFNLQHVKLTSQLHSHMTILKASPSTLALGAFENLIASKLAASIHNVSLTAYNKAALDVGMSPNIIDTRFLAKASLARAKLSAKLMSKSSAYSLEIEASVSRSRVASEARAAFASNYELRLAFFLGTTRGWELNKNAKKGWVVSTAHDMDDMCDDNEAQGLISIYDFFDSGVMYAPAHLGCPCDMYVYLKEDN